MSLLQWFGAVTSLSGGGAPPATTYNTMNFDGTKKLVTSLNPTADMTFSFWIKTSTSGQQMIFDAYTSSIGGYIVDINASNKIRFVLQDSAVSFTELFSTTSINDNAWHNVSGVYDSTTDVAKLYIDGVEEDSDTHTDGIDLSPVLSIGDANGGSPTGIPALNASMAAIKILNKSASVAEIQELAGLDLPSAMPRVHLVHSDSIKDACVFAIDGAENLPTTKATADFDALPNLQCHIQGDNGTGDLTGNNTTVVSGTITNPANAINGKATLESDGGDNSIDMGFNDSSSTFTLYTASQATGAQTETGNVVNHRMYYANGTADFPFGLTYNSVPDTISITGSRGNDYTVDFTGSEPSGLNKSDLTVSYFSGSNAEFGYKEASTDTGSMGGNLSTYSGNWKMFKASAEFGGGVGKSRFTGKIHEVARFTDAHSVADRNTVLDYFIARYYPLLSYDSSRNHPVEDANVPALTGQGIEFSETPVSTVIPELWLTGDGGFTDQSGNGYTINNVGATQTGAIYNGHAALSCDGVNDYFQANGAASVLNDSTWDCYIVCKHFGTASFEPLMNWLKYSDNNSYSWIHTRDSDISNGTQLCIRTTANATQLINDTIDLGTNLALINIRLDGTDYEFKINNETVISGTITNNRTDHDTLNFGALVRTGNPSGTSFGDYDICEVRLHSMVLSADMRTNEINYLIDKYDLNYEVNASELNGSSMSFSLADTSAVQGTSACSFFCWIKSDALSNKAIASKWTSTGNLRSWYLFWDASASNTLEIALSSDGSSTLATGNSNTTLAADTWYHVGFVFDGSNTTFYLNGSSDGSFASSGSLYNTTSSYTIGTLNSGSHFDGQMYQACFSKLALSAADALEIYNEGKALPSSDFSTALAAKFNGGNGVVHRIGNFGSNAGDELLDQTDGSNTITNNNSTPFTGTGLQTVVT